MKLVHLNTLPEKGLSHDPAIKKRVLIDKGEIPNVMMFGHSVFKPGQGIETHCHKTMFEVFYVHSGKAVFVVNGKEFEVRAGDCVTIEPNDEHRQYNPFDTDVTWLYFGIAVD
jgi:mannose-6-phosphate isomerase-like protein (cupin superfamily)